MKNTYSPSLDGAWIVEYNGSQKCFHLEEITTRLPANAQNCIKQEESGWYAVGIYDNREAAHNAIELFRTMHENIKFV